MALFYYVKIGLGAMPNNFLRAVLQVEHLMLLTIILNVEDGVNKYLGGWDLGLLINNLALYNIYMINIYILLRLSYFYSRFVR